VAERFFGEAFSAAEGFLAGRFWLRVSPKEGAARAAPYIFLEPFWLEEGRRYETADYATAFCRRRTAINRPPIKAIAPVTIVEVSGTTVGTKSKP
jgi:hypothetical protein